MDLSVGSNDSSGSPLNTTVTAPVRTPRRKLSMNMSVSSNEDENTPLRITPKRGYSDSLADSGFKSMMASTPRYSAPACMENKSLLLSSQRSEVCPVLGDVSNVQTGWKRAPSHKGNEKDKSSENSMWRQDKEQSPFDFKFPRPSSLPALPSSPFTSSPYSAERSGPFGGRSMCRQISSPMGRMTLQSPTAESEYLSEVFAGEMEEPVPSDALNNLLTSSHPAPLTSRFSGKNGLIRPTPVRPSQARPRSYDESPMANSIINRRGSLKRASNLDVAHQSKRRPLPFSSASQDSPPSSKPLQGAHLLRSYSCSQNVPSLSPGTGEDGYIGDFSKPFALPLVEGTVRDLKCITPKTLCGVLNGQYEEEITSYTIFDCRYPYEYKGGHIRGAQNVYTQEQLTDMLFSGPLKHPKEGERHIYILHCEFSSKRGPKMSRFLRETDRKKNGMDFPKLYYPEVYLLNGGYSVFFAEYPEMCDPQSYTRMDNEQFSEDLKFFKQNGDKRRQAGLRRNSNAV